MKDKNSSEGHKVSSWAQASCCPKWSYSPVAARQQSKHCRGILMLHQVGCSAARLLPRVMTNSLYFIDHNAMKYVASLIIMFLLFWTPALFPTTPFIDLWVLVPSSGVVSSLHPALLGTSRTVTYCARKCIVWTLHCF